MTTPASIHGHPVHPMLVAIPIGLWVFSFVCDLFFLFGGNPVWWVVAYYTLAGGEIGALIAAVPGFIDFLALRSPRARRVAVAHLGFNVVVLAMVGLNLWLRWSGNVDAWLIALSGATVVLLGVSGWLGGHLVHVLGVTHDPEATAPGRVLAAEAGLAPPPEDHAPSGRRSPTV